MIGDTPAYNEQVTVQRHGPLDIGVLERTLDEIVRRHETWRTTFEMGENEPLQIIHKAAAPVKLRVIDLRALPLGDRESQAKRLVMAEAGAPFTLRVLPLWRAIMVRMADEEYQLHLNIHHLVLDGVALYTLFLPELVALYDAFSAGDSCLLNEPELQYGDFAVWQRRTLTDEALASDLQYWKRTLADPGTPLSWPNLKPRPAVQTYRGGTEALFLALEVIDPLKTLASGHSASLFMALATGYFILLHRYTGQTDITLGTPTASRTPEVERIMGYFLNMMPIRLDLAGNPTFTEALRRVRTAMLDALQHGSVPLLRLLREIRPAYDPSRNPLFQIIISLQPPMPPVDPSWDLTQSSASSGGTKMDMYVNLEVRPNGLMAPIAYNTDLLDPADVRRMFADWRAVLEGAIAMPDCRIGDLPLSAAPVPKPTLQGRIRGWFGKSSK
jgi:hypothetical protein